MSEIFRGHAAKNACGQVQSHLRTLFFGELWCDLSAARAYGLPSAAFCRADSQSDSLAALLCNPFFFVHCDVDSMSKEQANMVRVHWACKGALLFSLSQALCVAPFLHNRLSLSERCELAASGFVLWDLWAMLGARKEAGTYLYRLLMILICQFPVLFDIHASRLAIL